MTFATLLRISRPRFWTYIIGPLSIVIASAVAQNVSISLPITLTIALYCTLPANLLIYGVNDIFDYDTDVLNAKKQGYEQTLPPDNRRALWRAIALTNLPLLTLLAWLLREQTSALLLLCAFLITGIGYSAPPLRTKTKPFLDAATNILYVLPAFALHTAITGTAPGSAVIAAAWLWCAAMHAYSAIPDIAADRSAHLPTIATTLGIRGTSFFCAACYGIAGILYAPVGLLLSTPYLAMCWRSYRANNEAATRRDYTLFPTINATIGFLLFWSIIIL
jgi:4-hydroxybenzoate polyprenyltransferase